MTSAIKSFVFYDADGVKRDFTFDFPYLTRNHVKVYVGGVGYGDFAWMGPYSIRTNTTLPISAGKIKIVRETPGDTPLVMIGDGTSLRAVDLNTQSLQGMYVAQEASDTAILMKTGALVSPDSDAGRITLAFPSIESRKGNVLGFDSNGQFRPFTSADMPKGETGDKGPNGNQGIIGPIGPTGPTGLQGVRGPAGSNYSPDAQGLTLGRAAWNGESRGFSYLDIETGRLYWKLSTTNADWSIGISFGEGAQGIQGVQGSTGPTGSQGGTGPQGIAGSPGLVWKGAWSSATAYAAKDTVSYLGSCYTSILAATNQLPTNVTYWQLVVAKGDTGPQGTAGVVGPTGPQGATGPYGSVDPATLLSNKTDTLTVGYIATAKTGAVVGGIFKPVPSLGNLYKLDNNIAHTFAAPDAPGDYTIVALYTNIAGAGSVIFSGFSAPPIGDTLTLTVGHAFFIGITKIGSKVIATVMAAQ